MYKIYYFFKENAGKYKKIVKNLQIFLLKRNFLILILPILQDFAKKTLTFCRYFKRVGRFFPDGKIVRI